MRLLNRLAVTLLIGALLPGIAACMPRGPVLDTTSTSPPAVGGTVSGVVRTSGGAPLPDRRVTVIEVVTGERHEAMTAVNGGYTIKVPRGRYRLEVELRDGETVAEQPADTDVGASDMDASRNFVIVVKGAPRPSP